jgi:REP element-mobilizing transposase RayT
MPNFRRYYFPNSYVFITSVTKDRIPIFESTDNINLFFETMNNVKSLYLFDIFAYVLLKDHFHCILHIPDEIGNFSKIIQSFKRNFTLNYKHFHKIEHSITIWQSRF